MSVVNGGLQGPWSVLGASPAVPGASQKHLKGSWSILGTSQGITRPSLAVPRESQGGILREPGSIPGTFQERPRVSLEHSWSVPGCPGEFLEHLWSILRALDHPRVLLEDRDVPGASQGHPTGIPLIFPEHIYGDPGPPLEHPKVAMESPRSVLQCALNINRALISLEPRWSMPQHPGASEPSLEPHWCNPACPWSIPGLPWSPTGASWGGVHPLPQVSWSLTHSPSPRSPVQCIPGGADPRIPCCL